MDVLIRADEACRADPFLLWDSRYDPVAGVADWALAGNAAGNTGGLAADAALATAVTLCMFSDAMIPPAHPLAYLVADGDRRGWWGDGVDVRADLGEGPLGSLLWVLRRAPLTPAIAQWARTLALQALSPLQRQGAVVRIDATATIMARDALVLDVAMYGRDGAKVFDRKFDLVWQQLNPSS